MIEVEDVHKGYGHAPLLAGIDLHVAGGRRLGLVGPAASGKTVLLKLLTGLERPDRGAIRIDGRELTTMSEQSLMDVRQRIGMAFQNYALFDFMTVGENVAFPLRRLGRHSERELGELASERLRQVGLSGSESKMPSELSGGMKKRVGIARATVTRPEILIYDEPTAGLDPVTTAKIYELLRDIQEDTGGTVIAVSSDIPPLVDFCDAIAMLQGGRIRYVGPAEAVYDADDPLVRQFVRGDLQGPL